MSISASTPAHSLYTKVTHQLLYKRVPSPSNVGNLTCQINHLAPHLAVDNENIFRNLFGITFDFELRRYIHCISRYEYGY